MTEGLILEAAQEADLDALVDLERRSFSHPWTPRGFREAIRHPAGVQVLVLRNPGRRGDPDRGIRAYCVFEAVVDELQIHNLAVHPEHRRSGLGRRLLELLLGLGARRGARLATLEVRRSNLPALELYRAFGFKVASARRDYYSHPTEDALVLHLRLPPQAQDP